MVNTPSQSQEYSRKEWIKESKFDPVSQFDAFRLIAERTRELRAKGQNPVVIVDLDGTVYDVRPRTLAILNRWADAYGDQPGMRSLDSTIKSINPFHIHYTIKETMESIGSFSDISPEALTRASKSIEAHWNKLFFSGWGVQQDHPYPGAREFVTKLLSIGATIVYLTGRHKMRDGNPKKGMAKKTKENLKIHKFPYKKKDKRTQIIFKENWEDDDAVFKNGIADRLRGVGEVAAIMENEPSNVIPMRAQFPEALMTFVHTQSNNKAVPKIEGDNKLLFEWKGVKHLR